MPHAAMSDAHVDVLREIYREWAGGNFRAGPDLYDPHVVLVLGTEFPDSGEYHGREGIERYTLQLLADWDRFTIQAEEFIPAGDSVVVAVHQQAVGSGSGVPVDMRYCQAWTFRGGAVIRLESFRERADALAAVGLS
jgi:ketosteroid isomerase-like protein